MFGNFITILGLEVKSRTGNKFAAGVYGGGKRDGTGEEAENIVG